jgi:hypothetical protein
MVLAEGRHGTLHGLESRNYTQGRESKWKGCFCSIWRKGTPKRYLLLHYLATTYPDLDGGIIIALLVSSFRFTLRLVGGGHLMPATQISGIIQGVGEAAWGERHQLQQHNYSSDKISPPGGYNSSSFPVYGT